MAGVLIMSLKRTICVMAAICAWMCFYVGTTRAATFDTWLYRMPVAFAGYDKAGTLTNFPSLIGLSTNINGFFYSQFSSPTGGDLRFAASNGTDVLPYEIEKWDTNGQSFVWVQVPVLEGTGTFF